METSEYILVMSKNVTDIDEADEQYWRQGKAKHEQKGHD